MKRAWMVANKTGLYIVDPDRKGAAPNKPKDAAYNESQKAYYARKYIEIHAVDTNARVQSEIDEITRRMINFEQYSLVAQNANENVTSLEEELAKLQSERKAKTESLVFQPTKNRPDRTPSQF